MILPPRSLAGPLGLAFVAVVTAGIVAAVGSSQLQAAEHGNDRRVEPAGVPSVAKSAKARAVAEQFLGSMARHDYAKTCTLLSAEYRAANDVGDPDLCALQLSIAFTGRDLEFKILDIHPTRDGFKVRALANGSPGMLTLALEGSDYRVASLSDV